MRIAVVGVGQVGVAAAYALFMSRTPSELVLVDKDLRRAEGEAMDLMHGQALVGRVAVTAGPPDLMRGADLVVVSAGVGQRPGESRLDLMQRNLEVFRSVAAELDRHCPDAVVLVATNPVDVLTYALQELSSRPARRVIGTGTLLDTARLRALIGARYGVDPQSVHAYVLGEHGDSEMVTWSVASIGGRTLGGDPILGVPWGDQQRDEVAEQVRRAAYDIIAAKGYTSTAIGVVIAHLAATVLGDRKTVLPVSVRLDGEYGLSDVCLSVPCRLGRGGIEGVVELDLEGDELAGLARSAATLQGVLDEAGLRRP